MEIEMSFENQLGEEFNQYEEHYLMLAKRVFNHLELDDYFIYEVNLISSEQIHKLNIEYRNVDRPTDVISFAFEDEVEGEVKILTGKGAPRDLGAIYISPEVAKKQAQEYGHSVLREMSFLFVHGLLHLLGYDHMKVEDETIMFSLQDKILDPLHL